MFPVQPRPEDFDRRGLFLCQDPDLRARVLPLFQFDPRSPELRPMGQGTAFRIDPWSRCATAFHVLEELFTLGGQSGTELLLRPDVRLAALQIDGLPVGHVPVPEGAWRPISGSYAIIGIDDVPLQPLRLRNVSELISLRIRPSELSEAGTPFLSVDLQSWHPRIGESVMALGYADLDVDHTSEGEDRPMSQYIFGSIAPTSTSSLLTARAVAHGRSSGSRPSGLAA